MGMKRVVADKVGTRFFKDADNSKVYIAMLDGREVLLVTYDAYKEGYISVTLSAHATKKVRAYADGSCTELSSILNDCIKVDYEVYEFDSLVEALKYITDNI